MGNALDPRLDASQADLLVEIENRSTMLHVPEPLALDSA